MLSPLLRPDASIGPGRFAPKARNPNVPAGYAFADSETH